MIADSILESPLLVPSLLGVLIFLQLVGFIAMLAMSGNVKRLMRWAASQEPSPAREKDHRELSELKEENSEQKQLFATFLAEDPMRKELSKKEQFAAFRRWRDQKGLNWKG